MIAPLGATVEKAIIEHPSGDLHLDLRHSASHWIGGLTVPAPWTFTSCLLSISSEPLVSAESGRVPASDLIGLEGASLSGIEHDAKQIDLVFDSIRLSVAVESA